MAAGLTLSISSQAEESSVPGELEELVVSATKFPKKASETTAQVEVLDLEALLKRGIQDVRSALNDSPGVLSTSTGGETGALGALLIRGTTTSDSQIVVDGIRINDSNGDTANNFLRGPQLNSFGRIELLKGPQTSLYGGNALGGILYMETPTGFGSPETRLSAEVGEFNTLNSFLSNSGGEEALSWFIGGGYNGTDNDARDQEFYQSNANLRLEWAASDDLVIGMTLRIVDQRFDDSLTSSNHLDTVLATVYVRAQIAEDWKASFVLGHYRQNYDLDFTGGFFYTDLDRSSFTTDHVITLTEKHDLRLGLYFENNDFESLGSSGSGPFSVSDGDELRYGGYIGWDWKPLNNLITKATVRWEDYAEYGEELTWNLGAAYEPISGSRLTANLGRAFTPPTFLDLFGANETGSVGNPDLEAQESIGWDIGIEQVFLKDHKISVAYFHNHLENAIERPFGVPPQNQNANSETNGVEIGLQGSFAENYVSYRVAWTYLDKSLNGQPQNYSNATVEVQPAENLTIGVGATYLDNRSYSGLDIQSSIIGRVYGRLALTKAVTLHARIENVNNEKYELFNSGFGTTEGPGFAFYTGVTATF